MDGRVRRLTPHEATRILGFPDDFIFPVSSERAYEQIGNSVAVPVLKKIAEGIADTGIFKPLSKSPEVVYGN